MKHLISIDDLSREKILQLFELSRQLKRNPKKYYNALNGSNIGLIFEKPSMRTWVSFEAGILSLGGGAIYLGPSDIALGIREEVRDVARVLNRYLEGVVLRTYSHETIVEFEKYFKKPVINGLSDQEHPCQVLADIFTLTEKFPKKVNPTLAFIGDGNNVLNSHILAAAKLGGRLRYATPKRHEPPQHILNRAKQMAKKTGALIEGFHDPREAVKDADAVYTDVWVSMGQEKIRKQKIKAFQRMQVNQTLLKHAKKEAVIMHCLPAHRGEEITDDVIESKRSVVFDQAENRLHIQKAILLDLIDEKGDL